MTRHQFLLFAIIPALFFNGIASIFYFVLFAEIGFANMLYGSSKLLLLLWPMLWLLFLRQKNREEFFPSFFSLGNAKKAILYGVVSGVSIFSAGISIFFFFENFFQSFTSEITAKTMQMGLISPLFYLLFSGIICILHSLFEEFYWRYFVFHGLRLRFGIFSSALLSSIGFSLHHFVILSQYFPLPLTVALGTAVGVGGFFWCILTAYTKTFLGNWISHIFVDVGIFGIGYILMFE